MVLTEELEIKEVEKAKHNLRFANLMGASLEGINLVCGNLSRARLNKAYLMGPA